MPPVVSLRPLCHRGSERIGIYFSSCNAVTNQIKIIKGARWSQSNACWYLLLTRACYQALLKKIKSTAALDTTALKRYHGC